MAAGPEGVADFARKDFIEPLISALGPSVSGQVARVAERFAVIAAAGELAIEWNLCPWEQGEARRSVEWVFGRWVEGRGGAAVAAEEGQAIARVRTFLQTHGDSRFESLGDLHCTQGEEPIRLIINRAGWREGAGINRKWFLAKEAWNEMCGDLDPRLVAETLDGAGLLLRQSGDSLTIVKKIHGQSQRVYCLTAGALGETVQEDDAWAA